MSSLFRSILALGSMFAVDLPAGSDLSGIRRSRAPYKQPVTKAESKKRQSIKVKRAKDKANRKRARA
jgi:hypothetical protein